MLWLDLRLGHYRMGNGPHGDGSSEPGGETENTRLAAHRDLPDLDVARGRAASGRGKAQRKEKLPDATGTRLDEQLLMEHADRNGRHSGQRSQGSGRC